MIYFILIGLSLMLLGGFLALVGFERSRGMRIMGAVRNRLDRKVARAAFIVRNVDWGAFVKHLAGTATERVLHDAAHSILQFVRVTERMLTRAVKRLRERRGITVTPDEEAEKPHPLRERIERVRAAVVRARHAARKPARRKTEDV